MSLFRPGDHVRWYSVDDLIYLPSIETRDKFTIYLWEDHMNYHIVNVDISIYQAKLRILTKGLVKLELDAREDVGHQGSGPFMPGDRVQLNNGRWSPAQSSTNWFLFLYNYNGSDMVYRNIGGSETEMITNATSRYGGIRMDRRVWIEESLKFLDPDELPD